MILGVVLVLLEVLLAVLYSPLYGALQSLGDILTVSILACFSSPGHGFARHLVEMKPTDALHLPI